MIVFTFFVIFLLMTIKSPITNNTIGIMNLPIFKNFSPIVGSGSKTPYLVSTVIGAANTLEANDEKN